MQFFPSAIVETPCGTPRFVLSFGRVGMGKIMVRGKPSRPKHHLKMEACLAISRYTEIKKVAGISRVNPLRSSRHRSWNTLDTNEILNGYDTNIMKL